MSFLAKLEMDSKEYNILNVEYEISQSVDDDLRPIRAPRCGTIHILLESSSDNNLVEWAMSHKMMKEGKITFYRRDASSQMKSVSFKDGFCVYLKEIFTSDGKNPMVTRITVAAREMTIGKYNIKHTWAGMSAAADNSGSGGGEIKSFSA